MYKVLDLFAGIGGFSLGLEETQGFETTAFCEIDDKAWAVLDKHWPDVRKYKDIKELTYEQLKRDAVVPDVIVGGFPCQDISIAGHGPGIVGERSGLWSEMFRLIRDVQPKWAIIENVPALRSKGLTMVLQDLCSIGYCCEWHCIPASYVGAKHRRDRVWIVAYPNSPRLQGYMHEMAEPRQICTQETFSLCRSRGGQEGWRPEPNVDRMVNGVPRRVDRLKQLGNAVVPAIPRLIGECILEAVPTFNPRDEWQIGWDLEEIYEAGGS